jgi:hypothetical protein
LALSEIHRITGHSQLFDTVFVYENYPINTTAVDAIHELAITEFTTRDFYHYPLSVQAQPGDQLVLGVQYDTDVFDADGIRTLGAGFERALVAMTADPGRRVSSIDLFDGKSLNRLDRLRNEAVLRTIPTSVLSVREYRAPTTVTEVILAGVFAQVLGIERIGVDDSFFEVGGYSLAAMRVVAAVNATLDAGLSLRNVLEAPSVAQLAARIGIADRPPAEPDQLPGSGLIDP